MSVGGTEVVEPLGFLQKAQPRLARLHTPGASTLPAGCAGGFTYTGSVIRKSAEITEALLAHLHPVAFDNLWTHTAALGSVFFSSVSLLSVPGVHAYHLRFPLLFCCSSSSVTLPLPLRNARVYHGSKSCHSPANRF